MTIMSTPTIASVIPEISGEMRALAEQDDQRPMFHFRPPAAWMNDPNGTIHHAGWYHVFYQHHPAGDQWGPMVWGHARSRDLVDWEHLPIALHPAAGEDGVWSGGAALTADGMPWLCYTAYPQSDAAGHRRFRHVAVRADSTLSTFTRETAPLLPSDLDATLRDDARDPFIFRAEGRTWCIHGARRGDRSVVVLHEALDGELRTWRRCVDLCDFPSDLVPFPECPNLVPVGEQWLLLLSPFGPVEGFLGTFRSGVFFIEREVRLDHHHAFYATNTLTAPDDTVVVLAWVRGWSTGHGWSGCLAAPRRVLVDGRACIRQEVVPAWLAALAVGAEQTWQGSVPTTPWCLDAVAGDQVVVRAVFTRAPGASVALAVARAADGSAHTIAWRGDRLHVVNQATLLAGVTDQLDLVVVIDRSLIEVFADSGRTVVTRINRRTQRGEALELVAYGAVQASCRWQRLRAARFTP